MIRAIAGVVYQAGDRACLALEHLDDLVRELVDVRWRQRAEQRLEPVEQHREVERGRGLVERDGVALVQRLAAAGTLREGDVALADQVAVAHLHQRAARERDLVVDP
jgi:hypothetical protein